MVRACSKKLGGRSYRNYTEDKLEEALTDIAFICLVPNSTHPCQPLDVAFFKPFKVSWRAVLTDYKKMDDVAAQTTNKSGDNETSAIKRNLKNGFYATGIFPDN